MSGKRTAKAAEKKPKLNDADRHKRFKDMAREVDADNDPDAFDRAFSKVVVKPERRE